MRVFAVYNVATVRQTSSHGPKPTSPHNRHFNSNKSLLKIPFPFPAKKNNKISIELTKFIYTNVHLQHQFFECNNWFSSRVIHYCDTSGLFESFTK